MTTRGQVYIKDTGVYLYQHCDSYNLPNEVRRAMQRVNVDLYDDEYLTRVIFDEMEAYSAQWTYDRDGNKKEYEKSLLHEVTKGTTGFGIGTQKHWDIDYLVTIDVAGMTVTIEYCNKTLRYTFEQFVEGDMSKKFDWEDCDD